MLVLSRKKNESVVINDDIVVVTSQGVIIRQPAKMIRLAGRNTQGVRLIRLEPNDRIAAVAVVPTEEEEKAATDRQEAPKEPAPKRRKKA